MIGGGLVYSYILGIACLASFVVAFGIYTSHEKGNIAKNIGLVLSLVVLTVSMALFAGFDILAEKVYVSSQVVSSKTIDLVVIKSPEYYLIQNSKGYEYRFVGEEGDEVSTFASAECVDNNIKYDANATPQVTEETISKEYYEKWIFLRNGEKREETTRYQFVIPDEENVLYEERAPAGR